MKMNQAKIFQIWSNTIHNSTANKQYQVERMISMFMNDEKPKDLQECFERMKKACETLENEYGYSKYAKFNPP